MSLASGTRLGPYEIVAPAGAGGMGEVYRARDTRLDRAVAIKVLPDGVGGGDRLQRFEQEARIVGTLDHPNILALHDIGSQNGVAFLVSELLEGETLRERLRESTLPPRKALEYAVQIASGLAAAHAKGIVHRDLKPDNIFLTRDGRVKILDFGLAKLATHDLAAAAGTDTELTAGPATHPGVVMGTVGYMSPEQVRGKPADHRSDLFSLGTVVYEMLAGQRAFSGESSVEVMNAILKEDPPDMAAGKQSIPPAIERVIRRCLEKSPEERFQSARDVAFALEAVSTTSAGSGARTALPGSAARPRPWLASAAIFLLLAATAGASFYSGLVTGRASKGKGVAFRLLNYRTEMVFSALFAPDGKTVVYSAAGEGNIPELYTLQDEYPEARPLGLPRTHLLAISSRGEMALLTKVRYVAHRLFTGTLATMPLGGGAPREILENVRQAVWAPDGSGLAIVREVNGVDRLEYPVGTVLYETAGYLSDPRFSPAGDKIAFLQHPIKFDNRGGVAVLDLASREHTLLADGYWGEEGLAWSPQGDEIFFAAGTGYASFHVYGVSLAGKLRVALDSAGGLTLQDIAPNGRWLATRDDYRRRVMFRAPGESRERDLSWLEYSSIPLLSGDGRFLVLSEQGTAAGKNYAVCVRRTDGSPVVRLGEGWLLDLSPDAQWALAAIPSSGSAVLYPLGAGEPRQLRSIGLGEFSSGRFFPDGKSVVLCGNQKGAAASRCYLQSLEDESRFRAITPEGTNEAFVSPDGKTVLAGIRDQGGSYALYRVEGGEAVPVPAVVAGDAVIGWGRDGRSILVVRRAEIPAPIERLVLASGRREMMGEIAPADRVGVLSVDGASFAADEKTFAYDFLRTVSSLFLIEGAK